MVSIAITSRYNPSLEMAMRVETVEEARIMYMMLVDANQKYHGQTLDRAQEVIQSNIRYYANSGFDVLHLYDFEAFNSSME